MYLNATLLIVIGLTETDVFSKIVTAIFHHTAVMPRPSSGGVFLLWVLG